MGYLDWGSRPMFADLIDKMIDPLTVHQRERDSQKYALARFTNEVRYVDSEQVVVTPLGFEVLPLVPQGFAVPPGMSIWDGAVWKRRTDYWWMLVEAVEMEPQDPAEATFWLSERRLRVVHS